MLARLRKAQEENESGFTLIELLVVIIIIGILAAIAIPVFLRQRQKGYDAGIKSDLRNAATAEESYLTDNNVYWAGTATNSATGALNLEGLTLSSAGDYSGGTQQVVAEFVDATGAKSTVANVGYCIAGTSASGNTFAYNSALGGLQPGTTATCP
jgi:type IV pilus assembly protein PilA